MPSMRTFLLLSAVSHLDEVLDREARLRSVVSRNVLHDGHRGFIMSAPEEITR
jgi:hypothetical protein